MEQYTVTINTTRTVEANSIPDAIAIAICHGSSAMHRY